jgi:hypothetical protein
MFCTRSTWPVRQTRAGRTNGGCGREGFEREARELRARDGGDADLVETVLGGLEGERGFALTFGFLTFDGAERGSHGVVDVDGGVERAAG